MDIAGLVGQQSHDANYKVGSLIVRSGQILSQGWNGTPADMYNDTRDATGNTLPWVIHSEANAIAKLAKNGGRADEATLYTTHSPCYTCACLVLQSGIKRVVYGEVYDPKAIAFLQERGLLIEQIRGRSPTHNKEGSEGKHEQSQVKCRCCALEEERRLRDWDPIVCP